MTGYVILEYSDTGSIRAESRLEFVGFAKSIREAEKIIRDDAMESFNPDRINDCFEDYCSHYLICEIFGEIKPVPSISVKMRLETVTNN